VHTFTYDARLLHHRGVVQLEDLERRVPRGDELQARGTLRVKLRTQLLNDADGRFALRSVELLTLRG